MTIIYVIIGLAISSIIIKVIKWLDSNTNNQSNENINNDNNNYGRTTVKDGMNFYFGKVLGKIILIIIILIIAFIIFSLTVPRL